MFLQRILLKNVKSIEDLELDLTDGNGRTRKWTFLVGDNGCGKSSLLRAVALLLAGSDALPELIGDPSSWVKIGQDECSMSADLVTAQNEVRSISLTIARGDNIKMVFERNEESLSLLDRALAHAPRNYFTTAYGAQRRVSSGGSISQVSTGGKTHVRAQSVVTLFSPDAALSPIESWAMDLHYRRGAQGLALIKSALQGLLPQAQFKDIDREQHQLLFHTPEGDMPSNMLSDGYLTIAAWYGDFLYRVTEAFGNYRDPLSARGLLLIDEIDVHLDATWKRQLFSFVDSRLPKMQIIATTDSPLMVHQAGEGEVFTLRRETAHSAPTLYQYPGAPRKLLLHQLLLSPIFNFETVDSTQVEQAQHIHRTLSDKPKSKLTAAERKQLSNATRELEDLPQWTRGLRGEEEERAHLEEARELLHKEMQKVRRTRKRNG
jgi:predicted ATPase